MNLTNDEYNVIEKIAKVSKCDCWFELGTDTYNNDCVVDLEEDKEIDLIDGLLQLDSCLTDLKDYSLSQEEIECYTKLINKARMINSLDRDRLETLLYNAIIMLETELCGKKLIDTELADEINITKEEYNYIMNND